LDIFNLVTLWSSSQPDSVIADIICHLTGPDQNLSSYYDSPLHSVKFLGTEMRNLDDFILVYSF